MSAVTFTAGKTAHEANVRGSERYHARHVVYSQALTLMTDLATGVPEYSAALRQRLSLHNDSGLRSYIAEAWDAYGRSESGSAHRLRADLALWLGDGSPTVCVGGEPIGFAELALNTALVAGSAPVRLLAYMQGSCEDHGYFEPPHDDLIRAITTGREHRLLRAGAGWEDVVELARQHRSKMIVMSYSVCEYYRGTLNALREARWPVDFARHLYAEEPQGYLTGLSVFDLMAEIYGER